MRERCSCGCGQATAATTRLRLCKCDTCGCPFRITRSWIERGACGQCGCGGRVVPECLEDRCRMPDQLGEAAWVEYMGRQTVSAQQAEFGRRGGEVQARRKAARARASERRGDQFTRDHRGFLVAVEASPVTARDEIPF